MISRVSDIRKGSQSGAFFIWRGSSLSLRLRCLWTQVEDRRQVTERHAADVGVTVLVSEITKRLICEKYFTAIAVESDWPDAYRVNQYVKGQGHDGSVTRTITVKPK